MTSEFQVGDILNLNSIFWDIKSNRSLINPIPEDGIVKGEVVSVITNSRDWQIRVRVDGFNYLDRDKDEPGGAHEWYKSVVSRHKIEKLYKLTKYSPEQNGDEDGDI